jgi:hypothetical protein
MSFYSILAFISILLLSGRIENATYPRTLAETAPPEAKAHFERGLLLLHNFEYVDAAAEFVLAQQKDPKYAMAYWGEAMTYEHPIWRSSYPEKARNVLTRMSSIEARPKTPLEKEFITGVSALFAEGSDIERRQRYTDHMAAMYQKYPDNMDVVTFYALALQSNNSTRRWPHLQIVTLH